jgi:diguanylate cyclase (GGDEF)-like protein
MPTTRTPLSQTLPSDLADFLSRPATIALNPDGMGLDSPAAGQAPMTGSGPATARMPVPSLGVPAGMALDPLTGLEGPASWSRIIETENARLLRYRRPVTVVVAEVEGLRRLAERLGEEPVERLLPVIADAFQREARSSDWVARIGAGRFAAFLPETDEIQAINYVERIRLVCEPWLASSAVPLRLAIGWSSPSASSDIEFALERAEERMHMDRRIPGKSVPATKVGPARVVSASRTGPNGSPSEDESGGVVPPAETGGAHERGAREISSEVAHSGKSTEVSIGKGRQRSPRTKTEPGRAAKS